MFIGFDLRPFSAVLSDLFIFVDNFLILENKSALNRLILRHCYFSGIFMSVGRCLCACALMRMRMRMRVCGWRVVVWVGVFGIERKKSNQKK